MPPPATRRKRSRKGPGLSWKRVVNPHFSPEGETPRDGFVIVNASGLYWTGSTWSPERRHAERFDQEPDPDRDMQARLSALLANGEKCWGFYLPAIQTRRVFARRAGRASG
jgi:hypothetical protein